MAEKPEREERTEDYQSPAVKEMQGREGGSGGERRVHNGMRGI